MPRNMSRPFNKGNRGPMMSDHLQNLRDLDLELELLKRKREMMEQQHSLMSDHQFGGSQSQYNYDSTPSYRDQRHSDGPSFSSNRDFSHLYDDPPQSRSNYYNKGPSKRVGDEPVWSPTPPKRSYGPSRGSARKFGQGPSSASNYISPPQRSRRNKFSSDFSQESFTPKPKPSISQRIMEQRSKAFKPKYKDFNPTKVVKPKADFRNKIPKKFLATEASKISYEDRDVILTPDKVPTQQMAGRLELALGQIMKTISSTYGETKEYSNLLTLPHVKRNMKQAIRERLREAMMGKPVNLVADIIFHYRSMYPTETDLEIVKIGKDATKTKPPTSETKKPDGLSANQYFKRNFMRILNMSLKQMFTKIQEVYEEENKNKNPIEDFFKSEEINQIKNEVKENKSDKGIKEDETHEEKDDTHEEKDETHEEKDGKHEEKDIKKEEKVSKNDDKNEEKQVNKEADSKVEEEEQKKESKENIKDGEGKENEEEKKENQNIQDVKKNKEEDSGDKPTLNERNDKEYMLRTYKMYERNIESILNYKLPIVLPNFRQNIMSILNANMLFKEAKLEIMKETKLRMEKEFNLLRVDDDESSKNEHNDEQKAQDTSKTAIRCTYFVKVLGRPSLPKRQIMQPFLNQFNTKSIKKVKTRRNILFVGFDNQDDFERIIAASGTVLGTDTIIITPNKPAKEMAKDNENSKDVLNNPDTDIINSSLDAQINDLLSSIRQEDEKDITCDDKNQSKKDAENVVKEQSNEDDNKNVENKPSSENDAKEAENQETEQSNDAKEAENEKTEQSNDAKEADDGEEKLLEDKEEATNNSANNEAITEELDSEMKIEADKLANEKDEGGTEITETDNNASNDDTEKMDTECAEGASEAKDKVEEIKDGAKESGKGAGTRSSARLSNTPSTIRTRRASRLAQNN